MQVTWDNVNGVIVAKKTRNCNLENTERQKQVILTFNIDAMTFYSFNV